MLNYLLGIMQWQDKKPSVSVANEYKLWEWYTGDDWTISSNRNLIEGYSVS